MAEFSVFERNSLIVTVAKEAQLSPYRVKHNPHDVALLEGLPILLALLVARMSQLSIIRCPTLLCITESLQQSAPWVTYLVRVDTLLAYSDLDQNPLHHLDLEEVTTPFGHKLVADHCFESGSIDHSGCCRDPLSCISRGSLSLAVAAA